MSLPSGTALGRYEIGALLGAGGMGEVYRARDTRLARDVAIKVLPEPVATDADRLRRFEQEAQAAAALSHPNIISVYDVGQHSGTWYVVSELLDGQTLRERLRTGALPVHEVVRYAAQIASGLAAAHDKGIVHRDLKPENVFVTRDDRVKILDFGLATIGGPGTPAHTEAITAPAVLTAPGTVLGTVGYMSPEQVRGMAVDHRSDIFSFGAVLFEMVAGQRAFAKPTAAQTMTAILEGEPPDAVPPTALAARVLGIAQRCLQKSPQRRFQSATDLALLLENETTDSGAGTVTPIRRRDSAARIATAAALLLLLAATALWLWSPVRQATAIAEQAAFTIELPSGTELAYSQFDVSRDGRRVVYAGIVGGRQQLFVRAIDDWESRPLDMTANASQPFFSHDGQSIGFFADGQLKRVPVAGGAPTVICAAPSPRGGVWTADDHIIFSPHLDRGLHRVSASGGTPEAITTVDQTRHHSHRYPTLVRGGKAVMFMILGKNTFYDVTLAALSLDAREMVTVLPGAVKGFQIDSGQIVYVNVQGETFIAPFDWQKFAIAGSAQPMRYRPALVGGAGDVGLQISPAGTLAVRPHGAPATSVALVATDGSERRLTDTSRAFRMPRTSPDGRRIALVVENGLIDRDLWLLDLPTETLRRVTTNGYSWLQRWSADSATLVFTTVEDNSFRLVTREISKDSAAEALLVGASQPTALGWLPDRTSLAYSLDDGQRAGYVLTRGAEPRMVVPPAAGPTTRFLVLLSPDGQWLSYVSDESGRFEVYVTRFPGREITRQVSRGGGASPSWAKRGSTLYYLRPHDVQPTELMRVSIAPDGSVGAPALAFRGHIYRSGQTAPGYTEYDVLPDGSIVAIKEVGPAPPPRLDVVVNWRPPAVRR